MGFYWHNVNLSVTLAAQFKLSARLMVLAPSILPLLVNCTTYGDEHKTTAQRNWDTSVGQFRRPSLIQERSHLTITVPACASPEERVLNEY